MKSKVPVNTGLYFKLINTQNCVFILPDDRRIDFRLGMPFDALDIYRKGNFKYLGLKDGAEVLFKKDKVSELVRLVGQAKTQEDVLIISKASDSETLKKAIEEKLQTF